MSNGIPEQITMNPNEEEKTLTLYDVIGGEDVLEAAVHAVYRRLLDDYLLAYFIRGQDLEEAKDFVVELFSMIFIHGLPEDNSPMEHDLIERIGRLFDLGMDEQHFDQIKGHTVLVLQSMSINRLTIVEVVRTLAPLRVIFENGARRARSRHAGARSSLRS